MKRLLLLMLLAVSWIAMQADQVQTLIVQLKNGSQTAFFLKDKPQVKFEGGNLKVTSTVGDTSFALSDVLRFTYTTKDPTGIDETVTAPTGVNFQGDMLVISQLKANSDVSIYAVDGKQLRQLTAPHSGTYRLNLSELPAGLYLVKADNVTYKIVKQ